MECIQLNVSHRDAIILNRTVIQLCQRYIFWHFKGYRQVQVAGDSVCNSEVHSNPD